VNRFPSPSTKVWIYNIMLGAEIVVLLLPVRIGYIAVCYHWPPCRFSFDDGLVSNDLPEIDYM
jgi:hypothetical protein